MISDEELERMKKELAGKVYGPDLEYVIRIVKRTVKQEDVLIRQILYTALSSVSNNPINLGIIAPTSEGKTYPPMEILQYFPQDRVWNIGQMSTKVLVRQKGTLIDSYGNPIAQRVSYIRRQIASLGNSKEDRAQKAEAKERLNELLENSKTLIDLSGIILLFLEKPDRDLFNLIKPILSHDKEEIEFPYVEKTQNQGIFTKKIVVRGWPACIFCSAKDESDWSGWPEIVSRFVITSPNMNQTKYLESNMLIAQTQSLPRSIQQKIIVSSAEKNLAKECVLGLIAKVEMFFKNNKETSQQKQQIIIIKELPDKDAAPVWIPYGEILGEVLRAEVGTDNRLAKRLFAFIKMVAMSKAEYRHRLILGNSEEQMVIASIEDLDEALYITQNATGIPAYKKIIYEQILVSLYDLKDGHKDESADGTKQEAVVGVTCKQLSDYYKQQTGKIVSPENIRKNFLEELENHNYIGSVRSVIDSRQNVYYPLIIEINNHDGDDDNTDNENVEMRKMRNPNQFCNFLQHSSVSLPMDCKDIPENWLIFEILTLAKYGIGLDDFKGCIADELNDNKNLQLLDKDGNRLTVKQFIAEYEKEASLIPYFRRVKIHINYMNGFGYIAYIGENWREEYKKLKNQDKFRIFRNKDYSCCNDFQNKDYSCCNDFQPTNDETAYKNHVILKHMLSSSDKDHPCYPCKADLERLGLKPQWKDWEI
jgi:hypothetical protein